MLGKIRHRCVKKKKQQQQKCKVLVKRLYLDSAQETYKNTKKDKKNKNEEETKMGELCYHSCIVHYCMNSYPLQL